MSWRELLGPTTSCSGVLVPWLTVAMEPAGLAEADQPYVPELRGSADALGPVGMHGDTLQTARHAKILTHDMTQRGDVLAHAHLADKLAAGVDARAAFGTPDLLLLPVIKRG